MSHSPMLVRVVRAMCNYTEVVCPTVCDPCVVRAWDVLRALKEPTEDMVEAVYEADLDIYWGYQADGRPDRPEDVWRAMIDAVLTEKSPIKE